MGRFVLKLVDDISEDARSIVGKVLWNICWGLAISIAVPFGTANSFSLEDVPAYRSRMLALPLQADTIAAERQQPIWTMEELEEVLSDESAEEVFGGTSWQRRKNSRVAMLCSLLFPGLGQLYNERPLKTAVALGVSTFYLSRILLNYRYMKRAEKLRDSYPAPGSENATLPSLQLWYNQDLWVQEYKERTIDWIWWSGAMVVVLVVDAYIDAHLHDMRFKLEGSSLGEGGGVAVVVGF